MNLLVRRSFLLIWMISGGASIAAVGGPQVHWLEDPDAVIERTLKNGTVEQAGPGAKCSIKLPPLWKVIVETEFQHSNFKKPFICEPIEWSNPLPRDSVTTLDFQAWTRFRGPGPGLCNRYIFSLAGTEQRHELPGMLFAFAHEEKMHCHDFPVLKPGQGRFLLLHCRKNLRNTPDPFFWFKIYIKFVPPSDTI